MCTAVRLFFMAGMFSVFGAGCEAAAQARKAVSAAEATGTFRHSFTGKFRGNSNEIKIMSIGKGKLRVAFDLTFPFVDGTGEMNANTGTAEGTADISGDTAVFAPDGPGGCRIVVKFVRPGAISVSQGGNPSDCGFGLNVSADGVYRKISGTKPTF
jgi:hypothetical protein